MLFTFPSRYWFTIGLSGVFSLTGWAPPVHTGFHVSRATQDTAKLHNRFMYGIITLFDCSFRNIPFQLLLAMSQSYNPHVAETTQVWAVARSLATTCAITFVFFSYGYLDVSVPHVCLRLTPDGIASLYRVAPLGNPRIKGYLHLPVAYRSLSRPSSPPRAKASTVCPCLLSFSFSVDKYRVDE